MTKPKGSIIRFPVEETEGYYIASPNQNESSKAGIIVLQEWWGLVPHIKDVTDRFASEGFHCLAPDLYHGRSTLEAAEAQHLMEGLDWPRAVKEIGAAVRFLRAKGCQRVGVVGFCMGGALSCLAAANSGVDAAVAFYGFPPDPNAMAMRCPPTLIFFGSDEGFFNVPAAKSWVEAQKAQGVTGTELKIYEGAGHAFFNDTRPEAYHREAAADAWQRSLAHFKKHLA